MFRSNDYSVCGLCWCSIFETWRIQMLWETWDSFPPPWGKVLSQASNFQTLYDFHTASLHHKQRGREEKELSLRRAEKEATCREVRTISDIGNVPGWSPQQHKKSTSLRGETQASFTHRCWDIVYSLFTEPNNQIFKPNFCNFPSPLSCVSLCPHFCPVTTLSN